MVVSHLEIHESGLRPTESSQNHARPREPQRPFRPRKCPQCNESDRVVKDGRRYDYESPIQRYLCLRCGFRFNGESLNLNIPCVLTAEHRVGASTKAKNLDTTATSENVAGETDLKGSLTLFGAKQLTKGLNEETIKRRLQNLEAIERLGGDLNDPLSVWRAIDTSIRRDLGEVEQPWTEGSKRLAAQAYKAFAKTLHITISDDLNFGKWKARQKLPWLPLTSEVDQLVAGCRLKMATFLEMLRQTGARSGELWRLTWKDIDLEHGIVTVNDPEKNGLPRQLKIDGKLVSMLNTLPRAGDKLWNGNIHTWRSSFVAQRNRIARKLGNPRLKGIHFHSLRHLYASLLYQKTLCLIEVQEKLGHRNIASTAIYTHLFKFEGDEYNHSIAKTIEEAGKLVDVGFEFVCDYGTEGKLFRKRK